MASVAWAALILWVVVVKGQEDWESHCATCRCFWADGRKTADCTNAKLTKIPTNISAEVRSVDFSGNSLYELQAHQFTNANLRDVQRLKFQNCNIEIVDETSFNGLGLLFELDLSKNNIVTLHKYVFRENTKLRTLTVRKNKIKRLEDGLFYNRTHLQKVDFSYNELTSINAKAFELVPMLNHIDFGYNKIMTIEQDFTVNVPKLTSLIIQGNPWVCDCHLQEFREKVVNANLIATHTYCQGPPLAKGKSWQDPLAIFACVPQIVEPLPDTRIEATISPFTISCKVLGEPQPDVEWMYNNRIIDRDPRQSTQKYAQSRNKTGLFTWSNLTIASVTYRDRGEYRCIAKNPAGVDARNVTLLISNECLDCGLPGSASSVGDTLPLIIGLIIGAVILIFIILFLTCCLCKRNSRNFGSKRHDMSQSTEYIGLDGRPEMEKALITDVNPIVKPPRQCSVPPSVTSGATEVSEVNKTLLDGDSIFAGDDESRSYEFDPRVPKSQNHLDVDYRSDHPYPPDLLSFPHRIVQVSPAGSSASTVADTTRLPTHHGPQSPITSPMYDTVSVYRTLPYSRSQSPFISPHGVPVRTPRPGAYVTIPRRPRQSWSSEPPSLSDIGEPLYDNLGLRTTALGNSKTSLNANVASPKGGKQVPFATTPTQCDPIAEHEGAPIVASTLPRNMVWGKPNGLLRSPEQTNNRRDSTHSLPTPNSKQAKIPPQPPPKPKKRASTGPLFEDEGEDGTEV